uniref:Uncharacterized protein n=1 Tax=Romanomermis culicivorax TaxID=13658 RepID=A0A915IHF4_ROMCU
MPMGTPAGSSIASSAAMKANSFKSLWRPVPPAATLFDGKNTRGFECDSNNFDWTKFSTAMTTPSLHEKAMAVSALSTALFAYSTLKIHCQLLILL